MFIDTKNILVGTFNWQDALINSHEKQGASYSTGKPIVLAKFKNKWVVADGHHRLADFIQGFTSEPPTFVFGELNDFQSALLKFHGTGMLERLDTYIKQHKPEWFRIFG